MSKKAVTAEDELTKDVKFLDSIQIVNAREHNLKGVDLEIPHEKLIVFTGISGSGKTSMAFDTIYAEGQRRYMETFSAYAVQFIGNMKRPEVDKISGLRPVIAIEQKSVNTNPRSTVGTVTEIYDFLRLLFARVADAYSHLTGEKMVKYSEEALIEDVVKRYDDKKMMVLAPVVKARKGHYRELFEQFIRQGFIKARIDGKIVEIHPRLQLDRYKVHDIEVVVDVIFVNKEAQKRLIDSIKQALKLSKNEFVMMDVLTEAHRYYSKSLMCPTSGISYNEPEPNTFSFNSPYGACPKCNGIGSIYEIDIDKIIPDTKKSIKAGGILPVNKGDESWVMKQIEIIGKMFDFDLNTPIEKISGEAMQAILYGINDIVHVKNEKLGLTHTHNLNFDGIANFISWQFNESESYVQKKQAAFFMNHLVCPECNGTRLKKEATFFRIEGKSIAELAHLDIDKLSDWFAELPQKLSKKNLTIAGELLKEIQKRLQFLLDVGLQYLCLNRTIKSLSGGEAQRIRLATQVGSKLTGVLYVLDEPSIGLHPRDNKRLIHSLKELRDIGNTVIVVEHDKDMIMESDFVVDFGPGAGQNGGIVTAACETVAFIKADTLTSQYINGRRSISLPDKRREGNGLFLKLEGASGNNLKHVNLNIPLGKFVCVTGVSGSGKSSLINETLYPAIRKHLYQSEQIPLPYRSIEGLGHIDKVIEVSQTPIGRTPRSNPATYTGAFDDVRKLFAELPESKVRGYKPGRFSFNVKGGRCETCRGAGVQTIEMNFLPDVYVKCENCNGKRYNRETLEVRYKGKSISDVLNMSIEEAVKFFENIPAIYTKVLAMHEVGLGYLSLGQPSTTISGGEAQRVKLAAEMLRKDTGNTLYILDEPTTGLHFEDIRTLLEVLSKLVDKGNTVLVIEHNLDVVKVADHIIDLGPEGGQEGGFIIAEGTPEDISKVSNSFTGQFLMACF